MALVRPDQCIAHVLPLAARDELETFFDRTLLRSGIAVGERVTRRLMSTPQSSHRAATCRTNTPPLYSGRRCHPE